MTNRELGTLLRSKGACAPAVEWLSTRDLQTAWAECPRGDWMLWLAARMQGTEGWPTRQQIVLAACACAELVLVHVQAGEDRPRIAIETARRWANGTATLEEVRATAAAATDAAYYAAAPAAAAAAYYAAAASTDAAYAAYYAAAATDARSRSLARSADLIRSIIPTVGVVAVAEVGAIQAISQRGTR